MSGLGAAGSSAIFEAGVPTVLLSPREVANESAGARRLLIAAAIGFLALFLLLPLAIVFAEAFSRGAAAYVATFFDPDARSAIALTLTVAAIVVPINAAFGVAAAWAVAKFDFVGKNLLITLIDLPLSVSPVVAGLVFVLFFGCMSSSRCRASRWRRCSSPSPSSRASSSR
jgi:sulfate transport system permease protein